MPCAALIPGQQGGALPAAPQMPQQSQMGQFCAQTQNLGGGAVAAAVVDINDLVGRQPSHRRGNFRDERRDVASLVATGMTIERSINQLMAQTVDYRERRDCRIFSVQPAAKPTVAVSCLVIRRACSTFPL